MTGKRVVAGRVAGFYGVMSRIREDEDEEMRCRENLVIGGDDNGVYAVERVVGMKRKKVSLFIVVDQLMFN